MTTQRKGNMSKHLNGHAQYFKDTGLWGAWVREPTLVETNSWTFLGSHLTQRLAERCQDRALLKLETDPTMSITIQLVFKREDYEEDEQLRRTLNRDQFFNLLREESSHSNNTHHENSSATDNTHHENSSATDNTHHENSSATECLRKFIAQEKMLGNLSTIALEGPFFDIDLEDQKNPSEISLPGLQWT